MVLAIVADTHLPRGARRLPESCVALISECDALVHAGDFVAAAVMDDMQAIGPPLHAVHGNVDDPHLRRVLPAELTLALEDQRIAILHDAGPSRGRLDRLRRRYPDVDAVIFGHSHMPVHQASGGFQIFNPGSPTERRRAPRRSMGLARVTPAAIRFQHVALS
jgi:putative phosphoesterase